MDTQEYQGHANHATWAMSLMIGNEREPHERAVDVATEHMGDTLPATKHSPEMDISLGTTAQALEEWQKDIMPDLGNTVWSMLLNGAMDDVDWREIAETYLAFARERVAA